MTRHVLLVPSTACPAQCAYCFGPRAGRERMDRAALERVADWLSGLPGSDALEITFHGGEPLAAGQAFYRQALPLLRERVRARPLRFAMQSNLWLLDAAFADLLREYRVALGTSLDGPQAVNDAQRGEGYFARTMAGLSTARRAGLEVGCICTVTRRSLPRVDEIYDFFNAQGLNFSLHAALPGLDMPPAADEWSLSVDQHAGLMTHLLARYLDGAPRVRIPTLDALCRSVTSGRPGMCTFGDCLGGYLAAGPDGSIYPCQRFAGRPEWRLGAAGDRLEDSPVWKRLAERQERVAEACGGCEWFSICRGGCPYNALAAGGGTFSAGWKDPHCAAYRAGFEAVARRGMDEVFAPGNLAELVERPEPRRGMLRAGRMAALTGAGPHPADTRRHARRILTAAALGRSGSSAQAAAWLRGAGLNEPLERLEEDADALRVFFQRDGQRRNNLYLHVTLDCDLRCDHCYARAGGREAGNMPPEQVERAVREAARRGFRHVVITGGEPLVHPQIDDLLDRLAALRGETGPMRSVLRTNLAGPLTARRLLRIACSTDEVVVSLDGDEATHDARRGRGTYARTLANLRSLLALRERPGFCDLSLAAVLPFEQAQGRPGDALRALAEELGIRRVRLRPLLPLGRAAGLPVDLPPEAAWAASDPHRLVEYGFTPSASCGMGQNLYVEPDGSAYPCYAWHAPAWRLGNLFDPGGPAALFDSPALGELSRATVDQTPRCRDCDLRYLCGGACRAWNRLPVEAQTDLNVEPGECGGLRRRAQALLDAAMASLAG